MGSASSSSKINKKNLGKAAHSFTQDFYFDVIIWHISTFNGSQPKIYSAVSTIKFICTDNNTFQSKAYNPCDTSITKNIYNQEKIYFFSFDLNVTLTLSYLNLQMTLSFKL